MAAISLDSRDVAAVLDAANTCDTVVDGSSAVRDLLAALASLVRCDVLFWNRVRLEPEFAEICLVDATTTRPTRRAPLDDWRERLPEHPIMSGRYGPVVAISDVLSRRQFERTWLYQEAFRPAGLGHEIGLELSHPSGEINVVVLSREPGRDFDDRDHLVLRLLRPHVDDALRRLTCPLPSLSPRELTVLRLVRDGLTDRQVARRLGVSEATVGKHLEHVFARTGTRSRLQAVSVCQPLLDQPPPPPVEGGRRRAIGA